MPWFPGPLRQESHLLTHVGSGSSIHSFGVRPSGLLKASWWFLPWKPKEAVLMVSEPPSRSFFVLKNSTWLLLRCQMGSRVDTMLIFLSHGCLVTPLVFFQNILPFFFSFCNMHRLRIFQFFKFWFLISWAILSLSHLSLLAIKGVKRNQASNTFVEKLFPLNIELHHLEILHSTKHQNVSTMKPSSLPLLSQGYFPSMIW